MDRVEIYTSKKKAIPLLIGSGVFVALGFWMLSADDNRVIGIASILFFGLGIFVGLTRLFKSEIAIVITSEGLNVNPKKSMTEFIKWSDISGFEEININNTSIVIINVKNPEYWLEKETNAFRKNLMRFNLNNYYSPFSVAASGLDISSNKLIQTLNHHFDKYQSKV